MNVFLENIDTVSAILKLKIEKNDYAEQVKTNLRKIRQKANMQGFRQGMVPIELIKKIYGKQALAEEINRIVPEQINVYLRDNQIKILGEPIPNETIQKKIDFDIDEDFEFCYDIALSPNFDIQLTKTDTLTEYRIIVDDESIDKQIDSFRKSYGSQEIVDKVESEDLVKGLLIELEEKAPKLDGIVIENAVLMPLYMKGKMEQKKLIGSKSGDSVVFNPYKAYKGDEAELSSLLRIDKSAVKEMKSDFSFEIKEITRYVPAELNQEFFDQILGKDAVKSEADFRDYLKDTIKIQYLTQTDQKTQIAIRNMLIQKADVSFADDILKRWLLFSNEKTTKEEVDNDFAKVVKDLKYHLAKEKLVEAHEIKVENQEVDAMARRVVRSHYAQYGVYSVTDENMDNHVKEMLKKQETVNSLVDRVLDEKVYGLVKGLITIDEQEVPIEEFFKIAEEQK